MIVYLSSEMSKIEEKNAKLRRKRDFDHLGVEYRTFIRNDTQGPLKGDRVASDSQSSENNHLCFFL